MFFLSKIKFSNILTTPGCFHCFWFMKPKICKTLLQKMQFILTGEMQNIGGPFNWTFDKRSNPCYLHFTSLAECCLITRYIFFIFKIVMEQLHVSLNSLWYFSLLWVNWFMVTLLLSVSGFKMHKWTLKLYIACILMANWIFQLIYAKYRLSQTWELNLIRISLKTCMQSE